MDINLVEFNTDIAQMKPENLIHTEAYCPFCDVKNLRGIIDVDDDIIFLRNKYPVIEDAEQFVLIEGNECESDMPAYSKEKMRRVIRMGLHHWQKLLNSNRYAEVLFFKNYGVMSGGTIRHPHMQIVAFKHLDSTLLFDEIELRGIIIAELNGVELNISTCPRVGFGELNIIVERNGNFETLADFIQIAVDYITKNFNKCGNSYNIFFYHRADKIFVKVIPRYATSPYFIGYNIHFLPNNVDRVAKKIQEIYF